MTETLPKVSVVCAWYNRADYIRDTIDSLLAQDYSNFDITVVNDGSPDPRVREILDSYTDPRLRVIHQDNTGFTRAIRRAIDESDGTYIAIQGAGDVSFPTRLKMQQETLAADKGIGMCGCKISNISVSEEGFGVEVLARIHNRNPSVRDFISRQNPFSHGEVMFRREVYEKVGGYRPFFTFAQDRDLWLRMILISHAIVIDEHLYQRRSFVFDGVANSFEKRLMQARLSALAVQCHQLRSKGELDLVEHWGYLAGLLRAPSRYVSDFFAGHVVQELMYGSTDMAERMIEVVKQEKWGWRAYSAMFLFTIGRGRFMRALIKKLLSPVIRPSSTMLR